MHGRTGFQWSVIFLRMKNLIFLECRKSYITSIELLDSVLTDYSSVGVGRSDGAKAGEMNPVFFRKDRFDMVRTKTFWLSETPEVAGINGMGSISAAYCYLGGTGR